MMYVPRMAETAREPIALKATVDPILIRERSVVITNVRRTAFKGMFHPGLTYRDMSAGPLVLWERNRTRRFSRLT